MAINIFKIFINQVAMYLSQDLQEFLNYQVLQKIDATTGRPKNENYTILSVNLY
jgi:hypothetical protein